MHTSNSGLLHSNNCCLVIILYDIQRYNTSMANTLITNRFEGIVKGVFAAVQLFPPFSGVGHNM